MRKYWGSEDFLRLKAEWDQKLKDSGFSDIEKEVDGDLVLKKPSADDGKFAGIFKFKAAVQIQGRAEYFYRLYQKYSQEQAFEDESDQLIMQRTMEGIAIQTISRELQKLGKRKFNRDTIRYIRRRYEHKWGIRIWTPEQMVSRKVRIR